MDYLVRFAAGTFPYATECQCVFMALQGAMMIRNGLNRHQQLAWFHAFTLSVVAGYGGGWLGFVWMGKPSSMLSNDLNFGSCLFAFFLVNYVPAGYWLCNTLPGTMVITVFAQLFRSTAIIRFIHVCFDAFKDTPSAYYPIPVFGPILYATLLGNMGGIVMKGLEGHVANGMPWPIQNGFFVASFYHFYVNDTTGPIGHWLRHSTGPIQDLLGLPDQAFAAVVVTVFMQVMGLLQLPAFLGPTFTPFYLPPWILGQPSSSLSSTSSSVGDKKVDAAVYSSSSSSSTTTKQQPPAAVVGAVATTTTTNGSTAPNSLETAATSNNKNRQRKRTRNKKDGAKKTN